MNVEEAVLPAAEAVVRETLGKTPLEAILVSDRGPIEEELTVELQDRLARSGLHQVVQRVRIVDAHPPREVVPAYREVSTAVSDVERYFNEAKSYVAQQALEGRSESQMIRDQAVTKASQVRTRADGESAAFLLRQAAHASYPELSAFRLLWTAYGNALAGKPKLGLIRASRDIVISGCLIRGGGRGQGRFTARCAAGHPARKQRLNGSKLMHQTIANPTQPRRSSRWRWLAAILPFWSWRRRFSRS